MKYAMILMAGLVALASCSGPDKAEMHHQGHHGHQGHAMQAMSKEELVQGAKQTVMTMVGKMQETMKAAMQEGGPIKAIEVCNVKAPKAAAKMSEKSGYQISRTSLKLRNPNNAPDQWELDVLNKFEERKAAGEDVATMAHAEIVEQEGKRVFRFMKAIPTQGQCLICHGGEVAPEVEEKLSTLYPEDQARGFNMGDIRGAFTLKKVLN